MQSKLNLYYLFVNEINVGLSTDISGVLTPIFPHSLLPTP